MNNKADGLQKISDALLFDVDGGAKAEEIVIPDDKKLLAYAHCELPDCGESTDVPDGYDIRPDYFIPGRKPRK